ncbi:MULTISPECIES: phytanoyl-CoA dioxygenase family protein [Streptomyces]|uniref:Phytanoyl-CoA dioxygenase family protein n=1 Tax=Streptomyces huasconensis TaxID=1854574 RepID=A0ABV3LXI0_9ACTN|nr:MULTISPECIES: phytanoyl-CoA dioxygenase family protein [Streptomyces]UFQ13719.1 phytanoyl-CoA dioxygenase family protein [Streptomyces huasconensis]WCL83314.1 phytanoyl-CoA dioxygenase family protein [Streptomyces sp. JCM 35825]
MSAPTSPAPTPREALARDGFVGPFPRFADEDTIAEIAAFYQDMLDNPPVQPLYNRYSVRDWHLVNDKVRELLTAPELLANLQRATGAESMILWRTKLFEKYPGDGAIDWHQEYGYFDGEEVGGHRPALFPFGSSGEWDWTLWLALTDVSEDDGVMEYVKGSQRSAYPKRMVKLTDSGAFVDPRNRIRTKEELLARAADNSLVLDIDTRRVYEGVDPRRHSLDELFDILTAHVDQLRAVVTEPFELKPGDTQTMPMKAGEYVIFSERCMHRSRASLPNAKMRLAVNARYTLGDTWVYPQRVTGDTFDGSNLDISGHRCVRLFGDRFNPANAYL